MSTNDTKRVNQWFLTRMVAKALTYEPHKTVQNETRELCLTFLCLKEDKICRRPKDTNIVSHKRSTTCHIHILTNEERFSESSQVKKYLDVICCEVGILSVKTFVGDCPSVHTHTQTRAILRS